MKKLVRSILFFASIVTFSLFQSCSDPNKGLTVSAIVTFGQTPPIGGPCTGNGLCSAVSSTNPTAVGTPAKFSLDPADPNTLLLTYKLADLQAQPQPEQQQQARDIIAMTAGSAQNPAIYSWKGIFPLIGNTIFTPLKLKPAAKITPTTSVTVTNDGTNITLRIKYEHL